VDELDQGVGDLTKEIPKPLLKVNMKPIIWYTCNKPVKFIARSLFLQGILSKYPNIGKHKYSNDISIYMKNLIEISNKINLSPISINLSYLSSLKNIDRFIIGSLSINNLKKNIDFTKIKLPDNIIKELDIISNKKKEWSNPRNWLQNIQND